MEAIKGSIYLTETLTPTQTHPEPEDGQETHTDLFMELFQPSMGELVANSIIVGRDQYSQPKPTQALIDFVESLVERFKTGELTAIATETATEKAIPFHGIEKPIKEKPQSIHFIEKKPEQGHSKAESIEELYSEGTLLYAMYPPPEKQVKGRSESYKGEGFLMAQAIDAYLDNATSEEREAFRTLAREEYTQ